MSVHILLISHQDIATAFVKTARATYGNQLPLPIHITEVPAETDPDALIPKLQQLTDNLDDGGGVLILTDLFGSTPSNIAQALQDIDNVRIVTGLNLPMLLRVLNYPQCSLEELTKKAKQAGKSGIVECEYQKK